MASRKKQLHQPPPELVEAVKEHKKWGWFMKKMEEAARSERDRERVMPSHPKGLHPYVKRNKVKFWFEPYKQIQNRLAHRKAGKIFI